MLWAAGPSSGPIDLSLSHGTVFATIFHPKGWSVLLSGRKQVAFCSARSIMQAVSLGSEDIRLDNGFDGRSPNAQSSDLATSTPRAAASEPQNCSAREADCAPNFSRPLLGTYRSVPHGW